MAIVVLTRCCMTVSASFVMIIAEDVRCVSDLQGLHVVPFLLLGKLFLDFIFHLTCACPVQRR